MRRVTRFLGATLAVGGLLTIGTAALRAQEADEAEGIIRISDCVDASAGADANAAFGNGACQNGTCPSGACPSMGCPTAGCPSGPCYNGCRRRCCCCKKLHGFLSWLDPHGAGTVSPDHGWAPPGKVAVWRRPVAYHKFWPDAWSGQPASAPVMRVNHVYMPTDTTQLGYYYQQVPKWWPNPAMIPPAPNPYDWHQPLCGNGACMSNCNVQGEAIQGEVIESGSQPAPAEAPADAPATETPAAEVKSASITSEVNLAPMPPFEPFASGVNPADDAPALQPTPPATAAN